MSGGKSFGKSKERLVWERGLSPKSFVAYPLGDRWPGTRADLWFNWTQGQSRQVWHWSVRYMDWADEGGVRIYRALAVEDANEAWPRVHDKGEQGRRQNRARQEIMLKLARVTERGVVDIARFDLESQNHQTLLMLVKECRERWEGRYRMGDECRALEALMNAASAELFQRRMARSCGSQT